MAKVCRKTWGDMDLFASSGVPLMAAATARRMICVAPNRVRRSPWRATKSGWGSRASRPRSRIKIFSAFGQIAGDGYYAFLAALAAQEHLRPRLIEVKIAQVDAERLGDTCTGSPEKKQQATITSSAWCSLVRRVDKG